MDEPKKRGRKKGLKSMPKDVKATLVELVRDYEASGLMDSDWKLLDPKDRFGYFVAMLPYQIPKLQAVEMAGNAEKPLTIEERLKALSVREKRD